MYAGCEKLRGMVKYIIRKGGNMGRKKWMLKQYDKALSAEIAQACEIDALAALLLVTRGVRSVDEARAFLSMDGALIDPFTIKDMDRAVERITQAVNSGETIAVYGDYDADGVTASALLCSYLQMIGAEVFVYIPEREGEGYGMHASSIDAIQARGASLIITVDNGIAAVEQARYAKQLGIDLVITDHHRAGNELPEACAVVDPHRDDCTCPFQSWAGVGVAFKLVCALEGGNEDELLDTYADLVMIGTVADVVELNGENRLLVRHGLRVLCEVEQRPGIQALLECAGMGKRPVTATSIAFTVTPRINAAGRMGSAKKAFELLMAEDIEQAREIAQSICEDNVQRQEIEREMIEDARAQLSEGARCYDRVLVVSGAGWHPGVVGIVAAKLADEYARPCVVLSVEGDTARGSARSVEGFSIFAALESSKDVITSFGGHTGAAGLELPADKIETFRETINAYAAQTKMPVQTMQIDCCLNPAFLDLAMVRATEELEPFGEGNPRPLFGVLKAQIEEIRAVGKNANHQRITFSRDGVTFTAMYFHKEAQRFEFEVGDVVDIAVHIERGFFRGMEQLEIHIKDMRHSDEKMEDVLLSTQIYEKYKRGEPLTPQEADYALATRDTAVEEFRLLRSQAPWSKGALELAYRICVQKNYEGVNAAKAMMALEAMFELGIVCEDGSGAFVLAPVDGKLDLNEAPVFKGLRAMRGGA